MDVYDFRIEAWQDTEACDYTCTGCAINRHGVEALAACALDNVIALYSWETGDWEWDEHCADCGGRVIEGWVPDGQE